MSADVYRPIPPWLRVQEMRCQASDDAAVRTQAAKDLRNLAAHLAHRDDPVGLLLLDRIGAAVGLGPIGTDAVFDECERRGFAERK